MKKNESISRSEFCELCQYVCYQLKPSGSKELDKETLNFAIYWQVCNIFDEQIIFKNNTTSITMTYQRHLQDLLDARKIDPFDVLQIVNTNIDQIVAGCYENQTRYFHNQFDNSGTSSAAEIIA